MATSIKAVWHSKKPYIRITIDRKVTYVSLSVNYQVTEKEWLPLKERVSSKNSFAAIINDDIVKTIIAINNCKLELDALKKPYTATDLKAHYESTKNGSKSDKVGTSLSNYFEKQILPPMEQIYAISTITTTKIVVANFMEALTTDDIFIEDIDIDAINKFQSVMQKNELSTSTQKNYHLIIRKILKSSVKKRIIEKNPYDYFDFPVSKLANVKKMALSREDIIAIKNTPLKNGQSLCRDAFLFCYYALGMRVSDMFLLRRDNIKYDIKSNNQVIEYISKKSKDHIKVFVLGHLSVLVDKYLAIDTDNEYVFPFLKGYGEDDKYLLHKRIKSSIASITYAMKRIAKNIGLDIGNKISSHVARRTAAQHLSDSGMQLEHISRILGHESTGVTETHYVTQDDSAIMQEASKKLGY